MRATVVGGFLVVAAIAVAGCDEGEDPPDPPELPPGHLAVTVLGDPVTSEAGTNAVTVLIELTTIEEVRIDVTSSALDEGTVDVAQLVFPPDATTTLEVHARGADDDEVDGPQSFLVTFGPCLTADVRYAGLVIRPVGITNLDDDAPVGTVTVAINALALGNGGGTVTSEPAGIACPGVCAAAFADHSTVRLTATPAPDARFGGWIGLGGRNYDPVRTIQVRAAEPLELTPTFEIERFGWLRAVDGLAGERFAAQDVRDGVMGIGGWIDGETTIDGVALPHGGGHDPVVASLATADGASRWIRSFGGEGDAAIDAISIVPDSGGDLLVGGSTSFGPVVIDGVEIATAGDVGAQPFVARLDGATGAVEWARPIMEGVDHQLAALVAAADGSYVACGFGAAAVARYGADGALVAALADDWFMTSCAALVRRPGGGWIAAGNDGHAAAVVWLDAGLAIVADTSAADGDAFVELEDLLALPDGGAIVALRPHGDGLAAAVRLLHVASTGTTIAISPLVPAPEVGRGLAVEPDPDHAGALLVLRNDGQPVLERWTIEPLERAATFGISTHDTLDFELASDTDHAYLLGTSLGRPLPSWGLALEAGGGYLGELQLDGGR